MRDRTFQIVRVGEDEFQFEVMIYGRELTERRPLLILHSIEFPMPPSDAYCEWMWAQNVQVIFVRRPGYGRTSPLPKALMTRETITAGAAVMMEAAMISALLRKLDLKDILLLALGGSNPLAYRLVHICSEISRTVFVNPPFNQDIIPAFRHPWLQTMLRQMIKTKSGIRVAEAGLKMMIKNNPSGFYKSLLKRSPGDISYLSNNLDDVRLASELAMATSTDLLHYEVIMSLTEDTSLKDGFFEGVNAAVLIGAEGTEFWQSQMISETDRLGLPLHLSETGDIMCGYTSPATVLAVMQERFAPTLNVAV